MKTSILIVNFLLCAVSFVSALTVEEIFDKMEENEQAQTSKTEMTQTVYKANGRKSVSKLTGFQMDKGDKSITIFNTPARIKGMKILMLNDGDDIWFYSPRTSRVRKIASGQKGQSVNGSDFSYADFSGDEKDNFNNKLLGEETVEGKECYKIEMIAKNSDETYSKKVLWVIKENFVLLKGDLYDEDGELWKVLSAQDVVKEGKYWTAKKIEMKNVQKGSRTVIEMNSIEYDISVNSNMFSERYLRK